MMRIVITTPTISLFLTSCSYSYSVIVIVVVEVDNDNNNDDDDDTIDAICYRPMYVVFIVVVVHFDIERIYFLKHIIHIYIYI